MYPTHLFGAAAGAIVGIFLILIAVSWRRGEEKERRRWIRRRRTEIGKERGRDSRLAAVELSA